MKITESIERECCHPAKDLRPYAGSRPRDVDWKLWFCGHCGQLWHIHRSPGDMDRGWERFHWSGWVGD